MADEDLGNAGQFSYYGANDFQPYKGPLYNSSALDTAGTPTQNGFYFGDQGQQVRSYDPTAYSSPQSHYLDYLTPSGYSTGLSGMAGKLGIDPGKIISGLQSYNGMSPDNNFNRFLGSPYALLDAAQQGDPSLSGAIAPFLAQNKGAEDQGQEFQAYQQQASNPMQSPHQEDYIKYILAMLGPAALAYAAPAAAGLAAAEGGGAAAIGGGASGAFGAGTAGFGAGAGTAAGTGFAAGGVLDTIAGTAPAVGSTDAAFANIAAGMGGAGTGAGVAGAGSVPGGETGAFDVSGSQGTGIPGSQPGAPVTDASASIPGTNNNPAPAGQPGDAAGSASGSGVSTSGGSQNLSQLLQKLSSGNFSGSDLMGLLKGGLGGGGPISTIGNLASSLYGIYNSQQQKKLAQQASQNADPQGPYRAGYAAQLANLSANPSSVTGLPGYQAGLDAVMRSQAANGYLGSGNMMAALQNYGQNAFRSESDRLSGLAGGNPGTAAALSLQGNAAGNQTLSQALAALGYGTRLLGV